MPVCVELIKSVDARLDEVLLVLKPRKSLLTWDEMVTIRRKVKDDYIMLHTESVHFGRGNNLQDLSPTGGNNGQLGDFLS